MLKNAEQYSFKAIQCLGLQIWVNNSLKKVVLSAAAAISNISVQKLLALACNIMDYNKTSEIVIFNMIRSFWFNVLKLS